MPELRTTRKPNALCFSLGLEGQIRCDAAHRLTDTPARTIVVMFECHVRAHMLCRQRRMYAGVL